MSKIGAEKQKGFIKECLENRKKRKFKETIDSNKHKSFAEQ